MRHGLRGSVALGIAAAAGGLALYPARPARAQFVTPTSYTATPGQGQAQGGSFNYFDDGGTQLTDGILGVNDWGANLGSGPAFEWVGWLTVDPTFSFTFASPVSLSSVQIGFNRAQGSGIFLPTQVTVNGVLTSLTGTEITDGTRGFLTFNTAFSGTSLSVSLADGDAGRWTFVDEVRFVSAAAVPEPGALVLASLGLPVLAVGMIRRRRRTG